MLRFCFCLWTACVIATAAWGQDSGPLVNRWFAAQTNLQTWSADFVQTRSLKALTQPLVATGKVWVAAPAQFRWELGQPPQTIAVRQPGQMVILYPRLKRAEKYALEGIPAGPMKDAMSLLDASFPLDRATTEQRFRLLSAVSTNALLQVTLQPRNAGARKFIEWIVLGVRTNDFEMILTEMRFGDGSRLRNDFTNQVLNQPLPPGVFDVTVPPDYTVIEPMRN